MKNLADLPATVLLLTLFSAATTVTFAQSGTPTTHPLPVIDTLFLIDGSTGKNLGALSNSSKISLALTGHHLTIKAHVRASASSSSSSGVVESVAFDLDGPNGVRIVTSAPYYYSPSYYSSSSSSSFSGSTFTVSSALDVLGTHTVSATTYSAAGGSGTAGKTFTVTFTVVVDDDKSATHLLLQPPTTRSPTRSPVKAPTPPDALLPLPVAAHCGCPACAMEIVWGALAGPYTCGARIDFVRSQQGQSESSACALVAGEFPSICGLCDPTTCSKPPVVTVVVDSSQVSVVASPPAAVIVGTAASKRCGGAVNTGGTAAGTCASDLWGPTGDTAMHCYAYGGASDPCAIHNNNDAGDGLNKNPSACDRETFYLWDEPDTQGKDYGWAGSEWAQYASRFAAEILALRARGVKFTSPLVTAGGPGVVASHLSVFYAACGPPCRDPGSPAYINVNAVNAFVGPWNKEGAEGCRDAATFITNELNAYSDGLPWYITNWSRLGTSNIDAQADAMKVLDLFFVPGSRIERVYWFGATDYGGGSSNNFLTQVTSSGQTLGQVWKANCDAL